MLTIKVSYRGKNILLPKGLESLQKIEDQIKGRFPGDFHEGVVTLKYQGRQITDYSQIETICKQSGSKSIKLEVEKEMKKVQEPAEEVKPTEVLPVNSTQIKQEINQKVQDNAEPLEQKKQVKIQQNKISLLDLINQPEEEFQKQQVHVQEKQVVDDIKQDKEIKVGELIQKERANSKIFSQKSRDDEPLDIHQEQITLVKKQIEQKQEQPQPQEKVEQSKQDEKQILDCKQQAENENAEIPTIEVQEVIVEPQIIGSKLSFENGQPEQLHEISPGVYQCFFCRAFENCNVCDTKRKIDSDSKIIVFMNKIIQKKVRAITEELESSLWSRFDEKIKGLLEERKQKKQIIVEKIDSQKLIKQEEQENKKIKQSIKGMFLQFDDSLENKKQVNIDEEFIWKINFKCNKENPQNLNIFLIEQRTGELLPTKIHNNFGVTFGPFKAQKEGKFEKTYRFCFSDKPGEHQIFGPKVGFVVTVKKDEQKRKVLKNEFRKYLQGMIKGYKISKSTQYIVEKLRQMSITEENFNESKQIMPDILAMIQQSK